MISSGANISPKAITYNGPQWEVRNCSIPEKTLIMGRGTGKTTSNADTAENCIFAMPRSRGFIVGGTYKQILTSELPAMKAHWARLGYFQNHHYFIGKKPPKNWLTKWPEPYHMPDTCEHMIWWFNGSIIQLISFDRKDTSRGGSYDWGLGIEAALLSKPRFDRELSGAMRPTDLSFKGNRWLGSLTWTSTMPFTQSGEWLFEAEQLQNEELAAILGRTRFLSYQEIKREENYQHPEYQKLVNILRQNIKKRKTLYLEATARENLFILGEDYFEKQKRRMHPIAYDVEIMNKRLKRQPYGFYPKLRTTGPNPHTYTDSTDYDHLDSLDYELTNFKDDCRNDSDLVQGVPMIWSFDFNSSILTSLCSQHLKSLNERRFLKNFFLKDGEMIDQLVDQMCDYYSNHNERMVYIRGDRNGHWQKRNTHSRQTYYEAIQERLKKRGWKCKLEAPTHDILHDTKYQFINRMLEGGDPLLPTIKINAINCKELVISLQNAPRDLRKPGIQKDKRNELDPENIPAEHATHFSDCFDYDLAPDFGKASFRRSGGFSLGFGSIG